MTLPDLPPDGVTHTFDEATGILWIHPAVEHIVAACLGKPGIILRGPVGDIRTKMRKCQINGDRQKAASLLADEPCLHGGSSQLD